MLSVHEKQRWIYASFFLFVFVFCAKALGAGEYPMILKREYGDEHDFLAACREGNVKAVQFFIDQDDFDVNKRFISGASGTYTNGLFLAAQNGHTEVVKMLVRIEGIDINNTWEGITPLLQATMHSQPEVVKILVNTKGIGINHKWEGATALFHAAQDGHAEMVRSLLRSGADPFQKWRMNLILTKSPLSAAKQGRPFFRRWNPDKYDRYTAIIHMLNQAICNHSAYGSVATASTAEPPLLNGFSTIHLQNRSKLWP
ncbi:ankyrin repeat domain-containing protein [Sansalvadorimonas verongulae]|uniref:ankyrin repeat domain-containing protein n=1 Tax=Sansalvadorimonas verongulae TaxID=2172824 RepID=UPI0012BC932A|nr:ankyrin repeat domain-containing protein [Sansalvadorimonas verongulae]MTI12199.1 ankyrin repeat domain-containing protein [Sansalvadorimonas verongulae]